MFSNKISTQDLFYSNPVDHFLGNDGGLLNSLESGFSSSHGYSQKNSKDLPSTCSQDLFSQTPIKNVTETQVYNMDYPKYISQNLLFGKKRSNRKFSFENKTKESDLKKNFPFSSNENYEPNSMSEITGLLAHLNEDIKKLNAGTSGIKEAILGMQKEFSKQNERISSFEEVFSNMLKENDKYLKGSYKKEEEYMKKAQKILNENAKVIKNSIDDLKNSTDVHQSKVLESMKRYSTTQANANKKTVEGLKNHNQQFMRKIDSKMEKVYSTIDTYFKKGNDDIERKVASKFDDLKTFINEIKTSITEIVASQKMSFMNSTHAASVLSKQQNGQKNTFKLPTSTLGNPSLNGSIASNGNSCYGTRDQGFPFIHKKQASVSQSSIHTPLADVIKQNQSHKYSDTSVINKLKITKHPLHAASNQSSPYIHKQQYSSRCTQFNLKGKRTTPFMKPQGGFEGKNMYKNDLHYSRQEGSVTRSDAYQRHKTDKFVNTNSTWPVNVCKSTIETATIDSSPYLTVFEAAMAEEYAFL